MTMTTDQPGAGAALPRAAAEASLLAAAGARLRHVGDLAALVDGGRPRWTEALLSEARTHLAGCLNAVQLAILLELGGNWLAKPAEALGADHCRIAVEQNPCILSPLLVGHLRHRAAAALMLRMGLLVPQEARFGPAGGLDTGAPSRGPVDEALAALRLSIDPWFDAHPLDRPMRADLPAEAFCELVWTAAVLLIDGLGRRMGVDAATACPAVQRAAEAVIARHDEQTGPFARASYVATLLPAGGDADRLAGRAALDRNLLLLAALGARRCGMTLDLCLTLLVDGTDEERAALAQIVKLSSEAYVALLTGLAPVGDEALDSRLPDLIARYRAMNPDEASLALVRWRGPEAMVEKLARIGRWRP